MNNRSRDKTPVSNSCSLTGVLRRNGEASGQQVSPPHAAKPSRIPVKLDSPVQIRHRQQIGNVSTNQMVTTPNHHRRRPQSMVERDCNFQVTRLIFPHPTCSSASRAIFSSSPSDELQTRPRSFSLTCSLTLLERKLTALEPRS